MTIWKWRLNIDDSVLVQMPEHARILTVQMQAGHPYLWALVDPTQPVVPRYLAWRGTGHAVDDLGGARYIGTVQMHDGAQVFHLFDRG